MEDFDGVKGALFFEDKMIVFLRDDKPGLLHSNLWDFPGGGREGNETSEECLIREVDEEFSIKLDPNQIVWEKEYPAMHDSSLRGRFFVANITKEQVDGIEFGDEGQRWEFISVEDFFNHESFILPLKGRLQDYLDSLE